MTIQTEANRINYTATGSQSAFPFNFKTLDPTHIRVYEDNVITTKAIMVTLNPDQDNAPGGTVTFTADLPTNGTIVTIQRQVPITQLADYTAFDAFPAESHEGALDKATLVDQQQQDELARSLKVGVGYPIGADITFPNPDPGKGLLWNSAGDGFENSEDDINGIVSAAQGSANAAASSASAAASSETRANEWANNPEDVDVTPGNFSAFHWSKKAEASIAFNNYLKGYEYNGLHNALTGDLNAPLQNGKYFVNGSNVTNAPADFTAGNTGVIDVDTSLANTSMIQILVCMSGPQANRSWIRNKTTTWNAWAPFGGGAPYININPPSNPQADQRWWDSEQGHSYIYYEDSDSKQWVEEDPAPPIVADALYGFMVGAVHGFAQDTPVGDTTAWLFCNGAAVSRTTYAALFAAIGGRYGSGDGSTTFNLPDYRGEFLRGQADGSTNDPDRASRTDRGDTTTGDAVGTKQADELRSHRHSIPQRINEGDPYTEPAGGRSLAGPDSITGANGGNETRPRNVNVRYFIHTGRAV